eukprot:Protomagalhaensia_sp_Gyna_25__1737@NODE_190_length_4541_cov_25_642159_g147_i0_p3_GENE_NODE_190_length_4541_cov_25_642159_g147_i0NODE_190_length_4541_cov_25_642159_g147_i0_p3_ORF_typecomplete_len383_score52_31TehB/PF03848_14/0_00012Methyltransf_31/PF13847_6/0_0049Methyltransf_25/PF13649_6/0_044Methyltransf_25/PF13649_6/1_4e04_NODE_190_length_4541_cov_25_642159_g147_i015892737
MTLVLDGREPRNPCPRGTRYTAIPLASLFKYNRFGELSPSSEPLTVLANSTALLTWGYGFPSSESQVSQQLYRTTILREFHQRGWQSVEVLLEENDDLEQLPLNPSAGPLWTPNPLLRFLVRAAGKTNGLSIEQFWAAPPTIHPMTESVACLDLGSGLCRDATALCRVGWTVVATDRRAALLSNGRRLARSLGIRTFHLTWNCEQFEILEDIEEDQSVSLQSPQPSAHPDSSELDTAEGISSGAGGMGKASAGTSSGFGRLLTIRCMVDCKTVADLLTDVRLKQWLGVEISVGHLSRFLERPVIPVLARHCKWVAIHHWVRGTEHPTQESQILGPDELASGVWCSSSSWAVYMNEETEYVDKEGRKRRLSMFIGMKNDREII